jgi:hypothetical protein
MPLSGPRPAVAPRRSPCPWPPRPRDARPLQGFEARSRHGEKGGEDGDLVRGSGESDP